MNKFSKMLIGTSVALLSAAAFSTSCPDVGGYKLSSSNGDHTRCMYTSYNKGSMSIQGQRLQHNCPRFVITDPNFRLDGQCRVTLTVGQQQILNGGNNNQARCQCTAVAR
jgi:hypothetical protein